jgi:diguanylate cyclase (GGDEF)-like protein
MGVEQSNKAVAASTTGSAIAAGISQEVSALDASRSNVLSMAARVSAQLEALQERARTGSPEDVERLGKWAALAEQESNLLRRRLRKQQHDFATFFEIVGQTSARALDVVAMQTYLLRTISGHFATPKLMIMRRMRPEDQALTLSAAQGVRDAECSLPLTSGLCRFALERKYCFTLKDLPDDMPPGPLETMGVRLVVPLIQEVEGAGQVLEGLLLLGPRLSVPGYNEEDIDFLQVLGKMLAICLRNEALYRRSIIDDLTGVASRGHFEAQLSQELNRIIMYGHRGMGLVLLDVDNFKSFNDTYGHQTGDRVLQDLARVLTTQVRNVDLVARYGGEEFAIILLEIERERMVEVADRLRRAVQDMTVEGAQGEKLKITCSFGLACFPTDATDKSTLIQLADEALYQSKHGGRNRVTICAPGAGLKRQNIQGPNLPQFNVTPITPISAATPANTTENTAPLGQKRAGDPVPVAAPTPARPKPMLWPGMPSAELDTVHQQQKELTAESEKALHDERRKTVIWPRNKS